MRTPIPSGGLSPASGLFAFLPHTSAKAFKEALGDEIERLIALADALDGDIDLEPNGDLEPSLGAYFQGYDLELDNCDDEDSHDRGSSDLAGFGFAHAVEGDDNEDLEPDEDREPSLGWSESGDGAQRVAASCNGNFDLEECVPTGFVRVRRALEEERRATEAETRKLGAFIRRLAGGDLGNVREVRF